MNWIILIRTLGHDEPMSLLDPEAYSVEDIEEDLIEIDMNKQKAKIWVDKKLEDYEAKIDEAIEAPEWMKEDLLGEAENIERELEDRQDEWQRFDDQERLVKSVRTFRRRVDDSEAKLPIRDIQENWRNEPPSSILRASLQKHMRSEEHVDELMEVFTDNSDSDGLNDMPKHPKRDPDAEPPVSKPSSQALEKQRERLEIRKASSSQSVTGEDDVDWSAVVENSLLKIAFN